MNVYERFAPVLNDLGYDVTPVVGKKPILPGWQQRPNTALNFADHSDKSIGVLLGGEHNLVAVDVDVLNDLCANELQNFIDEELGFAPRRIGRAPKFLMLFRCTELMRKQKTGVYEIDAADAAVEILGEGQQFVASGIHPDTKKKYYWLGDNLTEYRPQELTEVTPDAIRRFLARASSIMSVYGPLKGRVSDRASQPRGGLNLKELTADEGEILAALAHIPNDDEHYDDWVQTAHAIKGALGDDGYDLFCRWSARSDKDDTAQNDRLWRSIGKVTSVGAGSIFHWAGEHGFDLAAVREPKFDGPADITPTGAPEPATEISATPLKHFNPMTIPKRPWLFGDQLLTGYVTAFVAPPGVGKSTLTILIGIAVARGMEFAGHITHKKGKIWIYNNEDDMPEMHRRIAAGAQIMGVKLGDIYDEIFVNTGDERQLLVARTNQRGAVIQTPDVDAIMAEIKTKNIKLFIVDPFAETHAVNENSNDDIKQVAMMYRRIAKECDCAVLLVHHTRKTASGMEGGVAGNMDSARGAGAFVGVCRVVSTLFSMSKPDADMLGIPDEERHLFVRFDSAKANLSLITNKAQWFARQGVEIANGENIGMLTPWTPPGPFDGITATHLRDLQKLVAGRERSGDYYVTNSRSKTNWIGNAVKEACGLDEDTANTRIAKMLKDWVKNGALKIDTLPNKNRKEKESVIVGEWVEL